MTKYLFLLFFILACPLGAQEYECTADPQCEEPCEGVCTAICYEPYCYTKPRYSFSTVTEGVPVLKQSRRCRMERHQCAHIYNRYSHDYDYEIQPRMRIRHKRIRHCVQEPCVRYRKVYRRQAIEPLPECNATAFPECVTVETQP
ncbi:MAG: hypothetical protein WC222_00625 [Parachlamydiales bacterium]|jgi:hypothetical protein